MEIQKLIFFQIIFNLIFVLNYKIISKKIKIYDKPDKSRKFHKYPVPILGGLLVFSNILLFLPIFIYFNGTKPFFVFLDIREFLLFYTFFTIFFLIGLFDDIKNLTPRSRLFMTFLASF